MFTRFQILFNTFLAFSTSGLFAFDAPLIFDQTSFDVAATLGDDVVEVSFAFANKTDKPIQIEWGQSTQINIYLAPLTFRIQSSAWPANHGFSMPGHCIT